VNPLLKYRAVVQRVFQTGPHGPYALATSAQVQGSITFSLERDVWQESARPEEGHEVILEDVRKKASRSIEPIWRAYQAHFVRPGDC
jgi:hypothetical protein